MNPSIEGAMRQFTLRAALVTVLSCSFSVALSAERVHPPQQPVTTKVASPSTALTEVECAQAGGTVSQEFYGVCLSGKQCSRADENAHMHYVCIEKKK